MRCFGLMHNEKTEIEKMNLRYSPRYSVFGVRETKSRDVIRLSGRPFSSYILLLAVALCNSAHHCC